MAIICYPNLASDEGKKHNKSKEIRTNYIDGDSCDEAESVENIISKTYFFFSSTLNIKLKKFIFFRPYILIFDSLKSCSRDKEIQTIRE